VRTMQQSNKAEGKGGRMMVRGALKGEKWAPKESMTNTPHHKLLEREKKTTGPGNPACGAQTPTTGVLPLCLLCLLALGLGDVLHCCCLRFLFPVMVAELVGFAAAWRQASC